MRVDMFKSSPLTFSKDNISKQLKEITYKLVYAGTGLYFFSELSLIQDKTKSDMLYYPIDEDTVGTGKVYRIIGDLHFLPEFREEGSEIIQGPEGTLPSSPDVGGFTIHLIDPQSDMHLATFSGKIVYRASRLTLLTLKKDKKRYPAQDIDIS